MEIPKRSTTDAVGKDYDYSSTQIDLPRYLGERLVAWGRRHVPDQDVFESPNDRSSGREESPHVTVLYGIHTNKSHRVRHAIECHPAFTIRLGRMTAFRNGKLDVLKIEVHAPELTLLHETLKQVVYNSQVYDYQPHITVAYLRKDAHCLAGLEGCKVFEGEEFRARGVSFSAWDGDKAYISMREATGVHSRNKALLSPEREWTPIFYEDVPCKTSG